MVILIQSSSFFKRLNTTYLRPQNPLKKPTPSTFLQKRSGTMDPHTSNHRKNSSSSDLLNLTLLNTSRPLQITPATESKYLDVWKRVKTKIRAQIVIKKLLKSKYPSAITDKNFSSGYKIQKSSRVFTSTNDKLREQVPWYMFHPRSKPKMTWNLILLVLLAYTITVLPFSIAFIHTTDWDTWSILASVLSISFFADFLINSLTAYYDDSGQLTTSLIRIALNYSKSWMLVDIVSFFPFHLLPIPGQPDSFSKLLQVPKLNLLIKALKLPRLLNSYTNKNIIERFLLYFTIKNSYIRLYKSLVTIFVFLHMAACFWHLSARVEYFGPGTWVYRYGYEDLDTSSRYLISVYWAFTTLCTVGYGDISGYTNIEKVLCIIWMSCGLYFFSFTIGRLSSMLSSIDSNQKILINKLEVIDEFSEEVNLDIELRNRIKHALEYSANTRGFYWLDKLSIINELPKGLRYEVAINMHHGAAKCIKLLKRTKDQNIIAFMVPLLQPMLLEKDHFLYETGEFADEIYFVVRGRVTYTLNEEHVAFFAIQKGGYFGDIEVSKGIYRKYSARAVRNSELLVMNRELISGIESKFLDFWEEIKGEALVKEKTFEKMIIEIQEIMKLKSSGELENINVQVFRKRIEEVYENRSRTEGVTDKYSLNDVSSRLDRLSELLETEKGKEVHPERKIEGKKFTFSETDVKPYLKLDSVNN